MGSSEPYHWTTRDVPTPHFCCWLYVESRPLDLVHGQGERIAQGCEYPKVSFTGAILEFMLHND